MRGEFESAGPPLLLETVEGDFHPLLLLSLVGDLLNILLELSKVEVVDELEQQLVIDLELNANLLL